MFCCKAHTLCDAATELPIDVALTAGNQGDSPMLPLLLEQAPATMTGSARRFAAATGATMPALIMNGCWNRTLRLCCASGNCPRIGCTAAFIPETGFRPVRTKFRWSMFALARIRVAMFIGCPMTACLLAVIVCVARRGATSRATVGWR